MGVSISYQNTHPTIAAARMMMELQNKVKALVGTMIAALGLVLVLSGHHADHHTDAGTLSSSTQLADQVVVTEEMPAAPQNVFGKPLQACSSPGMAMTGFTR